MDTSSPLHTHEGGKVVDTDMGCSLCRGACPCPQACERRLDAERSEHREPPLATLARVVWRWL